MRKRLREAPSGGTVILYGNGGSGKSQIAAAFFRETRDCVDLPIWVNSASRESVLNAFAQAYDEIRRRGWAYRDAEDAGPAMHAERFLGWLDEEKEKTWLIVLDDVGAPEDLDTRENGNRLWPSGPAGRTLVTSRRTDIPALPHGIRIPVGGFGADEALDTASSKVLIYA